MQLKYKNRFARLTVRCSCCVVSALEPSEVLSFEG